mgnify:CR=1 FL=1
MVKIGLLVPYEEMLVIGKKIIKEQELEVEYMRVIQTVDAVNEARMAIDAGVHIIVAHGYQAKLIKQYTNIPLVEIRLHAQEIGLLIKRAKETTKKDHPRKAGYNRSTFYQYFLDIYDLLDEVEDTMADYICENRESIDMYSNSFVSSLVELYDTKSVYVNALLGVYGKQHFIEKLLSKKKLNIPELNLPDDNRFKPYLIEYHLSAVISIFQLWLHRGKDLSVDELMQLVADLYKGGLTQAGMGKKGNI